MRYRFCPPQYSMEAILSAAEMQAADARAIEAGLPGVCLMENAGRWVAEAAAQMVGPEARIGILCGTGNNGGDGFVAARHLLSWGYSPQIILCGDAERLRGDALVNAQAWGGGHVLFEAELAPYDLVVDALLGTGLRGEVRGGALEALRWLKAQRILAVDVPSGLCADTGRLLGPVVAAERTVTFAASKPGHWLHPGSALCGELWICDIGMQRSVLVEAARSDSWCILGDDALALALHPRPATTHKGSAGHLYIYGGSPGRTGAVRMSADAALRAGAGLVSIGTSAEAAASLSGGLYEVMCEVAQDLTSGRRDALVVGPGMSTEAGAGDWLAEQLPRIEAPVLVDADALNHLASRPEGWGWGVRIITPHPGEAGRLLGCSAAEVQADRLGSARRLAELSGGVCVLKGAHTLVSDGQRTGICPDGNPGMATAGMGDALAGIIGALLARGLPAWEAAAAGVVWHARAGDHVAMAKSHNSLITRDVIEALVEVERCFRA